MSTRAKPFHKKMFYLHENEPLTGTYFHMNAFARSKTCFYTEVKGNSIMVYYETLGFNNFNKNETRIIVEFQREELYCMEL